MFINVFVTNALHTNISEHVFRIKCTYFQSKKKREEDCIVFHFCQFHGLA